MLKVSEKTEKPCEQITPVDSEGLKMKRKGKGEGKGQIARVPSEKLCLSDYGSHPHLYYYYYYYYYFHC